MDRSPKWPAWPRYKFTLTEIYIYTYVDDDDDDETVISEGRIGPVEKKAGRPVCVGVDRE